jgi:hypothetical protein
MNAIELTWITAISAATAVVPSVDTTALMKNVNAANSRNQLSPFGRPNFSIRTSSCARRLPRAPVSRTPTLRANIVAITANAIQLVSALASAAPATPSSGAPRLP